MEVSRVYPSQEVTKQIVKLSLCDAYSPKVWVAQTHFWPLRDGVSFTRALQVLKDGLSRTLTEVPALVGTTQRGSEDPRDLVVQVESDDFIDFAFEDLTSNEDIPSYETLASQGFHLENLVVPFSQSMTLVPVSEGAPMLTVKLNLLKGGLALAFGYNHLLADASSIAVIEKLWAQHTADVSAGLPEQKHRNFAGDEETRKRLSTPKADAGTFEDEHWKIFPTTHSQLVLPQAKVAKEAALTVLESTKKAHLSAFNGQLEKTQWCIWHLTPESLIQLKQDASDPGSGSWISTVDALVGLFWSRLAFVKQSSSKGKDSSLLLFPISLRKRFQEPIADEYVGNAVDIVFTQASLLDLEAKGLFGVQKGAQCLRKAVSGWNQSAWDSWLAMAAVLPDEEAICPSPLALLANSNVGFNDYSKSQAHTLDWGSDLGRIDRTRYMKPAASLANCATAVIVHPKLADGGVEVATTCNDTIKKALEADAILGRYAKLTTAYT